MSKQITLTIMIAISVALFCHETANAQVQRAESGSAADSSDAAKKAAILASKDWQNMMSEFHEWLSVQVLLTPQQVAQLKAKLEAEVHTMSSAELKDFLNQWNAKLSILLGKDAAEAREWLAQNLVVMADGYRKQFLKELGPTDVSNMTAAEIEQMILEIRAKRVSRQKQSAAFNAARQQEVQYAGKVHADWQKETQQAAKDFGTAAKFGTYQSHYGPPMREYSTPGRYVPAYGGPFGGYGWGLFW